MSKEYGKKSKCIMECMVFFLIAAMALVITGCGKVNVYAKTIPYTIDADNYVSISFESKTDMQGHYGAFFLSARGIPAPESGTTYNPVQFPVNTERTIKVRAYFKTNAIVSVNPAFNIDKEIDFGIPALPAGSYTVSYMFNTIGGGNKRLALKDSGGRVIQEVKID